MDRSAIFFLSFNRLEFTRPCLEHLIANTPKPYRLVIGDNGSVDGTREYLQGLKASGLDADFIFYNKNYGAHRPRSHFMSLYKDRYEFLGFVANDVLVSANWLPDFERCLTNVPRIGIMGGVDREWGTTDLHDENGEQFYGGYHFYWSDGYWLMRSTVIAEIQKKCTILVEDQTPEIPHPGYFIFNSPVHTQEYYYNAIKQAGYVTACNPRHNTKFYWNEHPTTADWHKKYTIMTKMVACQDHKKYSTETGDLMEFEGGAWTDEPEWVRATPPHILNAPASLLAQLDQGVTEEDKLMMSEEDWKKTTFTDIFKPK